MCFEITSRKKPIPKKAKKDIIVFKAIRKDGKGVYNQMVIDNKMALWKKGNEYYETTPFRSMRMSYDNSKWLIDGGAFHSCIREDRAVYHSSRSRGDIVIKMIIPKGALYFKNKTEYVSNRIIYPRYKI